MKRCLFLFILSFIWGLTPYAQLKKEDFKIKEINKKVKDFNLQMDLNHPLNSFVSLYKLRIEGKLSQYRNIYSYRLKGYQPKSNTADIEIPDEKKEKLLNTKITEVIYYKDSIACILSPYIQSMYLITYFSFENGAWLCAGEDLGADLKSARDNFMSKAPNFIGFLNKINVLCKPPVEKEKFVKYLKKKGGNPKEFILSKLSKHRLVIYAEVHRRKSSWDLLRKVVNTKDFVEYTGTVFMELSSDKQNELNQFYESNELRPELILKIFRGVQLNGWYDKGMYEFLIDLWHLNKGLSQKEKIRVIAVDESRPFHKIKTRKDFEIHSDTSINRNEKMTAIISKTILINPQKRNHLFIVGMAHAYKSEVPGIATGKRDKKPTAAAMLKKIISDKQVYTIFPHTKIISNNGNIFGSVRHGVFDHAFEQNGNKAVAFDLKNSPFGEEPFDAIPEVSFHKQIGTFKDNFDGYLFLEPLNREKGEYLLYELITDEFLTELKRRAAIFNTNLKNWFKVKSATKENIIKKYKQKRNTLRWAD